MRSLLPAAPLALLLAALPLGCDTATEPPPAGPVPITLLAVYTADAAPDGDPEARILRAVEATNAAYARSGADVALVPVHYAEVDYHVTDALPDLRRLLDPDDGVLDEVHALRDRHAADVVALFNAGATVNAAVMATPETAFLLVRVGTEETTWLALAHEVAHLQGARHHEDYDPLDVPFPYGHGFNDGTYRTLVANGPGEIVPYFSSPRVTHEGVVLGDSARHDVARVLNETAVYLSNFRGPQTPTDFVPPGTWPVLP